MSTAAAWHTGAGVIPRTFPKGYRAFWIMKHEVTQEAYAEFLNTLNFAQQDAHTGRRSATGAVEINLNAARIGHNPFNNTNNGLAAFRNHIVVTLVGDILQFGVNARRIVSAGNLVAGVNNFSGVQERARLDGSGTDMVGVDGQDLAMNFVSWFNLLGYAEFSGLRPMTEFEFEKACRGPIFPVAGEFAWGSVNLTIANQVWHSDNFSWPAVSLWDRPGHTFPANQGIGVGGHPRILNFNSGDESFQNTAQEKFNAAVLYGANFDNVSGSSRHNNSIFRAVHRVGTFADSATTRQGAGATFWGVMNMTDNVNEMVVNATHSSGFVFNGHHGTGNVRFDGGIHQTPNRVWPTATGSFFARGFAGPAQHVVVSGWWASPWGAGLQYNQMSTDYNTGRVSNRSGVTRLFHFQNSDAQNKSYQGGIRLVRTQHWLQTSREAVAAAAAANDGDGDS
jgi:hypothetical protein